MLLKMAAVALLRAPALAVVAFEVLLNATSLFNHGNVRLPTRLDRLLRLVVVTPEMHRVHHSAIRRETDSNFGFNLPWWDYLLGTYRAQPAAGHEGMTIGLEQFRDERVADRLHWMLALPALGPEGDYPVNRRGGELATGAWSALEAAPLRRARSSSVRELHESIRGLEKKATPYLLGVMNLLLHGVEQPRCVPGEITARRASARGAWRAMVPQAHLFPPQAPRADHPFV